MLKSYSVPGTVLDTGISMMSETQPPLKELKVYMRRQVSTKLQHTEWYMITLMYYSLDIWCSLTGRWWMRQVNQGSIFTKILQRETASFRATTKCQAQLARLCTTESLQFSKSQPKPQLLKPGVDIRPKRGQSTGCSETQKVVWHTKRSWANQILALRSCTSEVEMMQRGS